MNILHLVNKYPDKPWDWYNISRNPNITMAYILANADKPWDWSGISYNKNITMTDIFNNPDKPWNWSGVSWNPNITIDFIENNIDKIDFANLSRNTFIDKEPFLKILLNIIYYDIVSIILGYL